jgi:ABC-type transport system involved in Fe-S cluster assembly fused permease/ATPase subunit
MWQTDWGYTIAMVVLRLFRAFIPLATLWVRNLTIVMADRIIVLQNGTVIEDETHATLVAQGGPYATLFLLQAEGYR